MLMGVNGKTITEITFFPKTKESNLLRTYETRITEDTVIMYRTDYD